MHLIAHTIPYYDLISATTGVIIATQSAGIVVDYIILTPAGDLGVNVWGEPANSSYFLHH